MCALRVADVMTRDPVTARPDATPKSLAELMRGRGISGVPIVDEAGRLSGIVTKRDVLKRVDGEGRLRAADLMTRNLVTVSPQTSLRSALETLAESGVRRLVVVDTDGALAGIVCESDLMAPLTRSDEDIRRDIGRQLLTPMPLVDCRGVAIAVEAGEVALDGEVDRRADAELLVKIVERVSGVIRVHDGLRPRVEEGPEGAAAGGAAGPEVWDEGWGE